MYANNGRIRLGLLAAFLAIAVVAASGVAIARPAVYTMSNATDGNEVFAYERDHAGMLRFAGSLPTGGLGTGAGLGNQGGVVLDSRGQWLIVVNAGSDSISVFDVRRGGLALTDVADARGTTPVSVAISRDRVFVVNAGSDNITGFRLSNLGRLTPLENGRRHLSGAGTAPAQIGFSPDESFVLVTEKATNLISAFRIDGDFVTEGPIVTSSAGMTPFAFEFSGRDRLVVSEAFGGAPGAGAVSMYRLARSGHLEVIAGSVPNHETAPCWLVVTRSGHHAFTTNTPSDSLSSYSVRAGSLTLLDGRAGEPGAGTRPLDMALSGDGRFIYTLNVGDAKIGVFRVTSSGSLVHLGNVEEVPVTANGLAAW